MKGGNYMKKILKKDFCISTKGIEIIQNIAIFGLAVNGCIGVLAFIGSLDFSVYIAVGIVLGVLIISLPLIITICLSNMIIGYMYNVEQQSKIQSNIDTTNRKILEELQVMNSYNCDKAN